LKQRLTLRAKTHAMMPEGAKAYISSGCGLQDRNGQQIFDGTP